eukprot:g14826.t1
MSNSLSSGCPKCSEPEVKDDSSQTTQASSASLPLETTELELLKKQLGLLSMGAEMLRRRLEEAQRAQERALSERAQEGAEPDHADEGAPDPSPRSPCRRPGGVQDGLSSETNGRLLIYGAHPVCCGNENIHLQNAVDFSTHAAEKINDYPNAPIVIMGDFNALEDWKSTKLYLGEEVHENGKNYKLKFKFRDAFRDTNSPYGRGTAAADHPRLPHDAVMDLEKCRRRERREHDGSSKELQNSYHNHGNCP